ncbi:MAG: cyclodeaminase/cyclohydrolase family protein [Eubacteriales bacterium]|nr:cyclodeaminase/cyclohydrolase family protein [Eubacteriales bacterium]
MKLVKKSVTEFTELAASKDPVPGGGGVSGLVGALAISLGNMVGELTVGKKKYADVEADLRKLMARSEELRVRLLELVDEDADNFKPLSEAYAIPKDADGRDETLEECLVVAMQGPLEIFDICCEVIDILKEFGEKGSKLLISDAATGAAFARGAMMGAAVNVKVNTALMKKREYGDEVDRHIETEMAKYKEISDGIFESIWQRF